MRHFTAILILSMMLPLQATYATGNQPSFKQPVNASVVVTKRTHRPQVNGVVGNNKEERMPVVLMNIELTAKQKTQFKPSRFNKNKLQMTAQTSEQLPPRVDLGMNGVPPLNQGMHGTCATFANTAAIDALLGKGSYISELCLLELGSYLEKRSYTPSGWEGSYGTAVLEIMTEFGIVTHDKQLSGACGGMSNYPGMDPTNNGIPISLDEYHALSEPLKDITWRPLLSGLDRMTEWNEQNHFANSTKLLNKIKTILANSDKHGVTSRITIGSLLLVNYCSAGACAKHHKQDDTWAITNAMMNDDASQIGGHEMIITGYDDDAVAIDNEGQAHRGLLILRNSWGDKVGDNGNYYMTYDFFKLFVLEAQEVVRFSPEV